MLSGVGLPCSGAQQGRDRGRRDIVSRASGMMYGGGGWGYFYLQLDMRERFICRKALPNPICVLSSRAHSLMGVFDFSQLPGGMGLLSLGVSRSSLPCFWWKEPFCHHTTFAVGVGVGQSHGDCSLGNEWMQV